MYSLLVLVNLLLVKKKNSNVSSCFFQEHSYRRKDSLQYPDVIVHWFVMNSLNELCLAGKTIVNHMMWDMYPNPAYKMSFLRVYCLLAGEMCPLAPSERSTGTEFVDGSVAWTFFPTHCTSTTPNQSICVFILDYMSADWEFLSGNLQRKRKFTHVF